MSGVSKIINCLVGLENPEFSRTFVFINSSKLIPYNNYNFQYSDATNLSLSVWNWQQSLRSPYSINKASPKWRGSPRTPTMQKTKVDQLNLRNSFSDAPLRSNKPRIAELKNSPKIGGQPLSASSKCTNHELKEPKPHLNKSNEIQKTMKQEKKIEPAVATKNSEKTPKSCDKIAMKTPKVEVKPPVAKQEKIPEVKVKNFAFN